jgi:predicted kinase
MKGLLVLLSGPPLSGKSTLITKLKEQLPDIVVVSTDDIRMELFGNYDFVEQREPIAWRLAHERVQQSLEKGGVTFLDATLRTPFYRQEFRSHHEDFPCALIAFEKLPLSLLQKRNRERTWKSFDADIIKRLHEEYVFPSLEEQTSFVWFVDVHVETMTPKSTLIINHIRPFLRKKQKRV